MSRLSQIGAAVIGTGFIGTVHVEALRRIGVQVGGVLGSTPERGAARANSLGVPRAYESLEAMLADPTVDVVHVTSPNHLHVPQAAAVLAAGRHVVCEKPLAMTAAESAGLIEQAAASGKVAAVNYNIRFYPLNQHLREVVEARRAGPGRASSPATTSRTGCSRERLELAARAGPGRRRSGRSATSARTGWTS